MYRQAVDIELNIPERRQYCAEAYYDIGIILNLQEEYDDAMKMLRKALGIQLAVFGNRHQEVASSYFAMGDVVENQVKYKEALKMYRHSLEINLNIPERREDYYNMGHVLTKQNQHTKSPCHVPTGS